MIIVLYSPRNNGDEIVRKFAGRWAIRHQVDHESADYVEHGEDEGVIWWFDWRQTTQYIKEKIR